MKRAIILLLIFVLAFCLAGCGNRNSIKNIKVTEANMLKLNEQVIKSKDLATGEAGLYYEYMIISQFNGILNDTKPSYIGKTVGQIIEEQKKIREEEKTHGK